jgi:hypothetical protein
MIYESRSDFQSFQSNVGKPVTENLVYINIYHGIDLTLRMYLLHRGLWCTLSIMPIHVHPTSVSRLLRSFHVLENSVQLQTGAPSGLALFAHLPRPIGDEQKLVFEVHAQGCDCDGMR